MLSCTELAQRQHQASAPCKTAACCGAWHQSVCRNATSSKCYQSTDSSVSATSSPCHQLSEEVSVGYTQTHTGALIIVLNTTIDKSSGPCMADHHSTPRDIPTTLVHAQVCPCRIRAIAGVQDSALFCCGSATGELTAHSPAGERSGTAAAAHAGGVAALCTLGAGPRFAGPLEGPLAVSGGHDAAAGVWRLRSGGPEAVLRCVSSCGPVHAGWRRGG